ncbi:hypothetical protein FRC12_019661 [Ceratobasidium sp. 428]|nr:hypothetical protein FRC09_020509 [Ceratobasidium sp. 395]KAG8783498.1 hypothetical protein FRC12_019661 [Ceratobasidium sp. 428]
MKFSWVVAIIVASPLAAWAAPAADSVPPAIGALGGMCAGFAGFPCEKDLCCYIPPRKAGEPPIADAAGICRRKCPKPKEY